MKDLQMKGLSIWTKMSIESFLANQFQTRIKKRLSRSRRAKQERHTNTKMT